MTATRAEGAGPFISLDEMVADRNDDADNRAHDATGIFFYGGLFSNFAPSPIVIGGKEYPDVEHFFQASKATNEADHERIRLTRDTWACKRLGNSIRLRDDWESARFNVMLRGLDAKFRIPLFRDALLATGDRRIYEDSPTDFTWGYRNGGRNLLGKALMLIRGEIRRGAALGQPSPTKTTAV